MYPVCERRRPLLSSQALPGAILDQELRSQLRATFELEVRKSIHHPDLYLSTRRYHVVQEFNKGVYDYIIASDEGVTKAEQDSDESDEEPEDATEEHDDCEIPWYRVAT